MLLRRVAVMPDPLSVRHPALSHVKPASERTTFAHYTGRPLGFEGVEPALADCIDPGGGFRRSVECYDIALRCADPSLRNRPR